MVDFSKVKQIDYATFDRFKPLARKLLEAYCNRVPEPERGNVNWNPNVLALIDLRDWFFKHLDCPGREKALRAIFNFVIIHYAADAPYRFLLDMVVKRVQSMPWQYTSQRYLWKEGENASDSIKSE